jgi:hypothetical protein
MCIWTYFLVLICGVHPQSMSSCFRCTVYKVCVSVYVLWWGCASKICSFKSNYQSVVLQWYDAVSVKQHPLQMSWKKGKMEIVCSLWQCACLHHCLCSAVHGQEQGAIGPSPFLLTVAYCFQTLNQTQWKEAMMFRRVIKNCIEYHERKLPTLSWSQGSVWLFPKRGIIRKHDAEFGHLMYLPICIVTWGNDGRWGLDWWLNLLNTYAHNSWLQVTITASLVYTL